VAGVACVIPAFDAAPTLCDVVTGVRRAIRDVLVIVVDDGSRDDTGAIAAQCADRVISFPHNRGKGVALRAGLKAASASDTGAALTIDADGQHDPRAAPALLQALAHADLVIGVRTRRGSAMPWPRRVCNALAATAVSACAGRRLADSQSGYRAIRTGALGVIAPTGDRYEYETDFLIQAARAGLRIACVPVPTIYGAPSHFREWQDTMRVARTICRNLPTAIRSRSAVPVYGK
jgi:glycosyltransferase involved in cell wall biosynthesis